MAATIAPAQDPRMALKNILHNGEAGLTTDAPTRSEPASIRPPHPTVSTGLAYTQACRRPSTASDTAMTLATTPRSTTSTLSGDGMPGDLWDVWQMAPGSSQTYSTADMERKPRAPRPSYSEEQKFYIMYARVLCDRSWPEIEDGFATIFGGRTKGGLTSIYYRVRKDWGMCEVLKSGPASADNDIRAVKQRAANFSREFLTQIGYLSKTSGPLA